MVEDEQLDDVTALVMRNYSMAGPDYEDVTTNQPIIDTYDVIIGQGRMKLR